MSASRGTLKSFLSLPEADRRLGPYWLKAKLGSGGFAPVWLADEEYGGRKVREVAIKLFAARPDDERWSLVNQAIIDEAQQLCLIEHPNVVRFYGLRTSEEHNIVGLVMEYIDGTPLIDLFTGRERLPMRDALAVGAAVASALAAVHRAGIVHRDIRPANVIATRGTHKLIDFGIALSSRAGPPGQKEPRRLEDSAITPLIMARALQGYLDPECVKDPSAPHTAASDLYALGALLFACVTGRIPAAGRDGIEFDILKGKRSPPPLRVLSPHAPPELARIVDELLDPDPQRRPRSAEQVMVAIDRARIQHAGGKVQPPPEEEGPFRGLGRFERIHRDVFFGRRADVVATIEAMRTRGLVALIGPSGSGKSSLARAGVLSAVAEGALGEWSEVWDTLITVPGNDPRAAIEISLFHVIGSDRLSASETAARLVEWVTRERRGLLLLVDQLEELCTLASGTPEDADSRKWTVDLLVRLGARPLPGIRVLCAARRDMLDPLLALGDLGRIIARGMSLVEPLRDDAWGSVLDAALATYGYTFEDDALRQQLLDDLRGTAGAMPLFQFALTQLWAQRDEKGKRITWDGAGRIGGITGALERYADATFEAAKAEGITEETLGRVLVSLTTPEGTRATKASTALLGFGEARDRETRAAIQHLSAARLLVHEADGTITLAHDALLTQWGRLRGWVSEVREDRLLAEEIERVGRSWEKWDRYQRDTLLWRGFRLSAAEDLKGRGQVHLSERANRFIEASRREVRRGRMIRFSVGWIIACVVVSFGVIWLLRTIRNKEIAEEIAQRAEEQRKKAEEAERLQAELKEKAEKALADNQRLQIESDEQRAHIEELNQKLIKLLELASTRGLKDTLTDYDKLRKEVTVPVPPPPNPEIEEREAREAIQELRASIAAQAQQKCAGDLKGPLEVIVTFAPSGNVTKPEVFTHRFRSTPQGSCIADLFKGRRIPPLREERLLTARIMIPLR
jgi:eukaryotic-like serine/threonine-protein kinase